MKEIKKVMEKTFLQHKIVLNDDQINKFCLYLQYLISENEKYNLTSITDEYEIIVKHFVDSVLIYDFFEKDAKVVDIGAGAGFPSIPLMIMREDLNFLIIDSVNKKVQFIKSMCDILKLKNCEIIHARCEDLARKGTYREKYDYCIARGVANLSSLLEYCVGFVKVNGKILAYKGKNYAEELNGCNNTLKVLGISYLNMYEKVLCINDEKIKRYFLEFEKIQNTFEKYPRIKNLPRLKPLG